MASSSSSQAAMLPPVGKGNLSYKWSEEATQLLIDSFNAAVRHGHRPRGVWKPEALNEVIAAVRTAGWPVPTKAQVQSKRDNLKLEFKQIDYLLQRSGFGFEDGRITAGKETWDELLAVQSQYSKWRNRKIGDAFKLGLYELFDGTSATGEYSQTAFSSQRDTYEEISDAIQQGSSQFVPSSQQDELHQPSIDDQLLFDSIIAPENRRERSPSVLADSQAEITLSSSLSSPQSQRSDLARKRKRPDSMAETFRLFVNTYIDSHTGSQASQAQSSQPLAQSDRRRAIQIISAFAKQDEWSKEELTRGLKLVQDDLNIDMIVTLEDEHLSVWLRENANIVRHDDHNDEE